MSRAEVRASVSLASIFSLRMLGLFLVLPVFAVHAHSLPGGDSDTLVGIALGIYGLAQACGQIPYGIASDRYGRKRIIVIGLLLFALGSFVAAGAQSVMWLLVGRALQGSGAISAAITAFIMAANGAKPGSAIFTGKSEVKIGAIADGKLLPGVVAGK